MSKQKQIFFKLFRRTFSVSARNNTPVSSSKRRIVVTGLGCISPLGHSAELSWKQLLKCESSISNLNENFKGLPCQVAAKIQNKDDLINLNKLISKSDLKSMSPATILALLASNEALESANLISINSNDKEMTGVCIGMGMFDLSDVYTSYANLQKGYNRVSPFFIPRILPNMACGHVSMRYGFKGPNHSISTACATGLHAIGDAFRFIKNGDANIMVAGSAESCIDPLSIAGFCRLRALSTHFNEEPKKSSRPFDIKRDGFVMGEGSAILILEELEKAKIRNATIYAEILGYGVSGDAHHLTSPSEDGSGAILAMQRALKEANIISSDIGYVNAHATSTPTGDIIEAKAIEKVFGQVQTSSTKGSHGHLLGSSGNLEALFTVLACKENIIPPSINCENLDSNININIVTKPEKWSKNSTKRIALKNSFGFGGTNASLCISNYIE